MGVGLCIKPYMGILAKRGGKEYVLLEPPKIVNDVYVTSKSLCGCGL